MGSYEGHACKAVPTLSVTGVSMFSTLMRLLAIPTLSHPAANLLLNLRVPCVRAFATHRTGPPHSQMHRAE